MPSPPPPPVPWPTASDGGERAVASFYEPKADFGCIGDPKRKLSPSRINDNTCDCPDGSDEPGTAACAHIDALSPPQPLPGSASGTTNATRALPGFWCANRGHVGAYLPFSFVNDGVCDYDVCCDGSEEFGHVRCPDRCAEMGREHRAVEAERRAMLQRAQAKRDALVHEAAGLRRRAESKLAELTAAMADLAAKKADLEAEHAEAKAQDAGRVVVGGGLGGLVNLAKTRVAELREKLDKAVQERTRLQDRVDELRAVLAALKTDYNPNFNDEGVKAAVKAFEDFVAREAADPPSPLADADVGALLQEDGPHGGVNWAEFEEQGDDTEIRE